MAVPTSHAGRRPNGPPTTSDPSDSENSATTLPGPRGSGGARVGGGRRVSRGALFAGLYFLSCWSVIGVLWPPAAGGVWAAAIAAVLTTAPIVSFIRRRGWRRYPSAPFRLLVVRPVLYTQLLLPLVASAGLLGLIAGTPFHVAILAGRFVAAVVLVAMVLLLIVGYIGSTRLVVQEVDARIVDLPPQWDGLRVAQISDLHVGPHSSRRYLARVARTVQALGADVIAITGDLVDDRAEDVQYFAAAFGALSAPHGVYLIAGNHDVYAGWPDVVQRLRSALPHTTLLVNDARLLARDGSKLAIVGTGDPAGRRGARGAGRRRDSSADDVAPDIDRALQSVPPGVPVIALAHNPALWPELAARGVALTLSGHTHWGQFALPRLGWSLAGMFLPHAMGAYTDATGVEPKGPVATGAGGSLLYISPGTGYWGLPFRIGANPEITLVTITRGAQATIAATRRIRAGA